jgi:hypothetical protein
VSRVADIAARALPWLAFATALVAATRFFGDAIWPCPVSCQGGGHYQRLWGVPVHVPAVLALLGIAVLAWRRRPETAWLAWGAAGGSLYFLWVAWMISLRCPYCFTVHAGVLLCAALAAGAPWLPRLALLALGFLSLHFAFQPTVVVDGPDAPVTPAVPAPDEPGIGAFLAPTGRPAQAAQVDPVLDRLRRQGSPQAAYVLEIAIDLHCPHCAAAQGPLMDALKRAITEGRVEVVHRFMTRRSAPTGRELARHVLAARDAVQAGLLTSLLLGTPEGRGWAVVSPRVAEVADPAVLERTLAGRSAAVDALLDADALRLRELRARATPFAALSRRNGDPLGSWNDRAFDPQAIAREIPFD